MRSSDFTNKSMLSRYFQVKSVSLTKVHSRTYLFKKCNCISAGPIVKVSKKTRICSSKVRPYCLRRFAASLFCFAFSCSFWRTWLPEEGHNSSELTSTVQRTAEKVRGIISRTEHKEGSTCKKQKDRDTEPQGSAALQLYFKSYNNRIKVKTMVLLLHKYSRGF